MSQVKFITVGRIRQLISKMIKESSEKTLQQTFEEGSQGIYDYIEEWTRWLIHLIYQKKSLQRNDPQVLKLESHIEKVFEEDDTMSTARLNGESDFLSRSFEEIINIIVYQIFSVIFKKHRELYAKSSITFKNRGSSNWTINFDDEAIQALQKDEDEIVNLVARRLIGGIDNVYASVDMTTSLSGKSENPNASKTTSAHKHLVYLMFLDLYYTCQEGETLLDWVNKRIDDLDVVLSAFSVDINSLPMHKEIKGLMKMIRSNIYRFALDSLLQSLDPNDRYILMWSFHEDLRPITSEDLDVYFKGSWASVNDEDFKEASLAYYFAQLKSNIRLRLMPDEEIISELIYNKDDYEFIRWNLFK